MSHTLHLDGEQAFVINDNSKEVVAYENFANRFRFASKRTISEFMRIRGYIIDYLEGKFNITHVMYGTPTIRGGLMNLTA